jgi:hypothetical protein
VKTLPRLKMKRLIIFSFLTLLIACNSHTGFERRYYERTTKIKFPNNYKVVATVDNQEFITITLLDLDKETLKEFATDNNFELPNEKYRPRLLGLFFLDSVYHELPDTKTCLIRYVDKEPGKVGWTYLADTSSGRLYCEIRYPDAAGN